MYGALILFEDDFVHIVAISFTALVLTELTMVALTVRTWHYLMILAELVSLAIYILSLILLRGYFGMHHFYLRQASHSNRDFCASRFRVHPNAAVFVEGVRHHSDHLSAALHSQVLEAQILATNIFKAILISLKSILNHPTILYLQA
jgi:hypothetical protein